MWMLEVEICENPAVIGVIYFIKELLKIVAFCVPIGLILMVMLDFLKNVIAGNTDQMQKNVHLVVKRILSAVMIFLVFTVVSFMMSLLKEVNLSNDDWFDCYENANEKDLKIFQELYDARKEEEDYEPIATDLKESDGIVPNVRSTELAGEEFALAAKKVWKKIVSGDKHFTYRAIYYVNNKKRTYYNQIPITNSYCDCSSLVSWVLYEYGYTEFGGKQKKTGFFYNTDFKSKFGWTVIPVKANENVTKKVKVGDILVRINAKNGKAAGVGGHILIVAKVKGNNVTAYDCGNDVYVANGKNPNGVSANWFMKYDWPGKIIRVTKV